MTDIEDWSQGRTSRMNLAIGSHERCRRRTEFSGRRLIPSQIAATAMATIANGASNTKESRSSIFELSSTASLCQDDPGGQNRMALPLKTAGTEFRR